MKHFNRLFFLFFIFSFILIGCSGSHKDSQELIDLIQLIDEYNFEKLKENYNEHKDLLNKTNEKSESLLHHAAAVGDLDIVNFLLSQNIQTDIQDQQGNTPLIVAIQKGYYPVIKALINHKVDLYIVNNQGYSAAKVAFELNKQEILKLLVAQGITKNDYYPRLIPTKYAKEMIVKPFGSNENRLIYAMENNDLPLFEQYLEERENKIDFYAQNQGETLLIKTIKQEKIGFLEALLKRDASSINHKDAQGTTPLMLAISLKNIDMIRMLILTGADMQILDNEFKNILMYAVLTEDITVVNFILYNFKGFNEQDIYGNTALHYAIQTGQENIISVLLESGANPNIENKLLRETPLHIAAKSGLKNIYDTLIKFNANPHLQNQDRQTPENIIYNINVEEVPEVIDDSLLTEDGSANIPAEILESPEVLEQQEPEILENIITNDSEI